MSIANHEATFKLYKNGKDTERTITVYGQTEVALKRAVDRLMNDYPEEKEYKLELIEK